MKLKEYSKRAITAMIILWFAGAFFGGIIVAVQVARGDFSVQIDSLLNYIGLPMGGGIVGYLIKSAFENKEKIKRGASPGGDIPGGGMI